MGSLVGLAIGDALGSQIKDILVISKKILKKAGYINKRRQQTVPVTDLVGGGPYNLKAGEWSDETATALALADSLVRCNGLNQRDFMESLVRLYNDGEYCHSGKCFDMDKTVRMAILDFIKTGNPLAGSYDSDVTGNGSIVRLAPIAMFYNEDVRGALTAASEQSKITHYDPMCLNICQYMMIDMLNFYRGISHTRIWKEDLTEIDSNDIKTGYVEDTYNAVKWAVQKTDNFKDAVLMAVNLADRNSDSVGAVAGQIAGAIYGLSNIPEEWVDRLAWKDYILEMADKIYYEEE